MNRIGPISRRIALGFVVAVVAAPVTQAANRPDDRSGLLGVAPAAPVSKSAVRPDDRAGRLGVGPTEISAPSTSLRPDDRRGPLGVGPVELARVSAGNGFDWGDAGIGVAAGFGLALGLSGALLLALPRIPRVRRTGAPAAG